MKKLLLAAAMLLGISSAAVAQTWEVGQEITTEIEWGNLSFENDPMDFWRFEGQGSTTQKGGLFEVYSGTGCDLYQYVKLPAGMYKRKLRLTIVSVTLGQTTHLHLVLKTGRISLRFMYRTVHTISTATTSS